jgi:3-oxoacyl-[acyl-carrier-protein] synthase-3
MNAEIVAANMVVPPHKQSNSELAKQIHCDPDWISMNLGVENRYVCPPGFDPALLAAQAALPVIQRCGAPELIIFASASVRQFLPDTSIFVAKELNLSGVGCYSIHATCLSFLLALNQAVLSIRCGQYSKVLIVSAELASQSRDFKNIESAGLLGDGAAAVMLQASQKPGGLRLYRQYAWPEHAELSEIRGGGLLNHPRFPTTKDSDYYFKMNGDGLLRATVPRLTRFLADFFADSGLAPQDIDWVVPHQASAAGMRLLNRMGFAQERIVDILRSHGNCVAASIPMALASAMSKFRPSDKVLFLGSAAGLSLGAVLWEW